MDPLTAELSELYAWANAVRADATKMLEIIERLKNPPAVPVFRAAVLRQRDARWRGLRLGTSLAASDSTIGRYGCLVTSIAYVMNTVAGDDRYTPASVQAVLAQNNGYSNGNRVIFRAVDAFGVVRFRALIQTPGPVSAEQLAEIDDRLAAGLPVIVKVDFESVPGVQEHYVVIAEKRDGEYMIADPWHDDQIDGAAALVPLLKRYPTDRATPHDAAHAIEAIVLFDRLLRV